MNLKSYTVLASVRINHVLHKAGDVVQLAERQARYLVLSGQLELSESETTSKKKADKE